MPKSHAARLKAQNDKLWSEIVRRRDGKCLVCGRTDSLQAHHAIVTKRRSLATRWHLGNGVALCYHHHLHQLHREGDAVFLRTYLAKLDARIPLEFQTGLAKLAETSRAEKGHTEVNVRLLDEINISLRQMLAGMMEDHHE